MDAQRLVRLDDSDYEQLVLDHAHPPARDPGVWAVLIDPALIDRTRGALNTLFQRNSSVLRKRREEREQFRLACFARGQAGKEEWFASKREYDAWRHRAANFSRTVQNALSEINKAKKDLNRSLNHQVAQNHRDRLRDLALAVHKHQAAHARAGGIAEQADYELWRALDQITVPIGPASEPTSLRTMLDIYWTDVTPVAEADEQRAGAERTMRAAPGGQAARFSGVPRARHVDNGKHLA
ncbi:hypothetical protein [Streptomyces sp. NPDC050355]|uniref:hypothetical protein n=1 Tax=Streptomyces sp. NPDC050355 TaxID=3365609 RepID=UPI0037941BC5